MNWSFLFNLIGIGSATQVDDSGEMQILQVTEGAAGTGGSDRVTDKVRRVVEYGSASNPPLGTEVLLIRRGGDRGQSMVIGSNHRPSRPKNLQPGEYIIYNANGGYVWIKNSGIVIDGGGHAITVQNGDLHVVGDVVSRASGTPVSLNGLRDAYDLHHHTGVSTGSGVSGTTDAPV